MNAAKRIKIVMFFDKEFRVLKERSPNTNLDVIIENIDEVFTKYNYLLSEGIKISDYNKTIKEEICKDIWNHNLVPSSKRHKRTREELHKLIAMKFLRDEVNKSKIGTPNHFVVSFSATSKTFIKQWQNITSTFSRIYDFHRELEKIKD